MILRLFKDFNLKLLQKSVFGCLNHVLFRKDGLNQHSTFLLEIGLVLSRLKERICGSNLRLKSTVLFAVYVGVC